MKNYLLTSLMLFFPLILQGQSVNVPLEYWGYFFLERLQTRGLISASALSTRPLSRDDFAALIAEADELEHRLSNADISLLSRLRSDFCEELVPYGIAAADREPHFMHVVDSTGEFYADLYGRQTVNSGYYPDDDSRSTSRTVFGGIVRGHLGGIVGFNLDAHNALLRGQFEDLEREEHYDPSQGLPVTTSGKNVYQDRALAYFVVEKSHFRLEAGRDVMAWGPGLRTSLCLSHNMPPADKFHLSLRGRRIEFSAVHLHLRASGASKYLAAHRLDFKVSDKLSAGLTETAVYGNRDMVLGYAVPLIPFRWVDRLVEGDSNTTLAADFNALIFPGVVIYGEWFLDDEKLSFDGARSAYRLGGRLADPLSVRSTDLSFEYVRIQPLVYSAADSLLLYTHYDHIIGHPLGPDSDLLLVQYGIQASRDLRFEFTAEYRRRGPGEGEVIAHPAGTDQPDFLQGQVEKQQRYGIEILAQVKRDLFAGFSYFHSRLNHGSVNGNSNLFSASFYFNY